MTALPVVSDSLDRYLAEINRFPVLSREEEFELAKRWYEKRDISAAHRLVTSNLRFVVKIALEYRGYGCSLKDLIQEGNIGLMTAVKKFNPYRGYRLITYAAWWIRAFIQEYIIKTKGLVKRGTKALKRKLFYRNTASNPEELDAQPFGTEESLREDLSLDAPISDEDEEKSHLELLRDPSPSQEEVAIEREKQLMLARNVRGALALLTERERYIIEKRIMAERPASLQAIGDELGLTKERIRQIENTAIRKLRKALDRKALPETSSAG